MNAVGKRSHDHPKMSTQEVGSFSIGVLVSLVGNEPDLHKRILGRYIEDGDEMLKEFDRAVCASETSTIHLLAHKMKSSSKAIGAYPT
ncbi:MAG: Hpt domain-containing protein [Hahellaceae bacterium]|nr:Hpt domain-containing protein [Hahellaceae bacterium]